MQRDMQLIREIEYAIAIMVSGSTDFLIDTYYTFFFTQHQLV